MRALIFVTDLLLLSTIYKIDTTLESLPKRKRDGAHVIDLQERYHKATCDIGDIISIKR